MDTQRTFFDREHEADQATKRGIEPRDPNTDVRDVRRLMGQNAAILARLQQGPATTSELATIALKYTGRLSDLRAAGYVIKCHRGTGGNNIYRLQQ